MKTRAIAVLVGSSLLFAVMALLAKQASARLPGPEVACVRFVFGALVCAAVAARYGFVARNRRGLFFRGLFGGASVLCYFLSIQHLPVGLATLLNYTAPVFTALWAALFLDEPLRARGVLALLLATAGVALVTEGTPHGGGGFGGWVLVGALGAVLSGAAIATIRYVRRTDGAWEIFSAFCVVGALITAGPAVRGWVQPEAHEWALMLAVGATSVAAQVAMTWSLGYLNAAPAGVIAQLTPVASLALGYLVQGEKLTLLSLGGAAVALVGISWDAWGTAREGVIAEEP